MTTPLTPHFTTQIVHADRLGGAGHGAIHQPVHTSVQYGFDKVEDLIAVFQGTAKGGFNYARQGTPTTAALESMLTQMERGQGSIVFSTGMAGICAIFLTLLKAGDHLVASKFVFGNTNSVFGTLADLGIEVTTVDVTDAAQVAAAVRPHTRMVFVETIANPGTQIPDLEGIGALCKERGLLYVVDNTVASPYLFRPGMVGAGLVVHSLTKSIAGHGDALGGAVIDTGVFDWSRYPNIFPAYRKGDARGWGLQQLRKKGLRDMGGALSSSRRAPDCTGRRNAGAAHGPHQRHCAGFGPMAGAAPRRGAGALPAAGVAPATCAGQKAPQGGFVAAVVRVARSHPLPAPVQPPAAAHQGHGPGRHAHAHHPGGPHHLLGSGA